MRKIVAIAAALLLSPSTALSQDVIKEGTRSEAPLFEDAAGKNKVGTIAKADLVDKKVVARDPETRFLQIEHGGNKPWLAPESVRLHPAKVGASCGNKLAQGAQAKPSTGARGSNQGC